MDTNNFEDASSEWGDKPSGKKSTTILQFEPDDCEVKVEEIILKTFGIDISHEELIERAKEEHWYVPGKGTALEDFGALLEDNGIHVTREINGDIFNLLDHLSHGHKVIVGVSIPSEDEDEDEEHEDTNYHSVLLTGLDVSDPDDYQIVIQDPATGEVGKKMAFADFVSGWKDADYVMVSTTNPPPAYMDLQEMEHFDYDTGHIDKIGELNYDDFSTEILPKVRSMQKVDPLLWQDLNESFEQLTKGNIGLNEFLEEVNHIQEDLKEKEHLILMGGEEEEEEEDPTEDPDEEEEKEEEEEEEDEYEDDDEDEYDDYENE